MAQQRPLDLILPLMAVSDIKAKIEVSVKLLTYLRSPDVSRQDDFGSVVDALVPWLGSSNFKVQNSALDILIEIATYLKEDFRPYMTTVIPSALDRLGDNREVVREHTQEFFQTLMCHVIQPAQFFEKFLPAFSHKNARVREESLLCLTKALSTFGSGSLQISKLLPVIVPLLQDPTPSVRDMSISLLVDVYKHIGDRLKNDLQRKYDVPQAKMQTLLQKFEDVKVRDQLLPTASLDGGIADDEPDRMIKATSSKRSTSAPPVKRQQTLGSKTLANQNSSGAVDEDAFLQAFEEVPQIQLYSAREIEDHITAVCNTLSDEKAEWNKRVDMLKKIRSLILAGATAYDELYILLRQLEIPFQAAVKDLRSQVVREACVTISYMARQLGLKFDHFAEAVLPSLINLIPNSAKVVSTAGIVTIRFIISYVPYARLVPLITSQMANKSKDIRRQCCEFIAQLLSIWPTHVIERHVNILHDALRKGIADADADARVASRKAYWSYSRHFPEQGEIFLQSLDPQHRKHLQRDQVVQGRQATSSLHRINAGASSATAPSSGSRTCSVSTSGSTENLFRLPTVPKRSALPMLSGSRHDLGNSGRNSPSPSAALRSNSAIDLQAAQRAKARAQYAAASRLKAGSGASLRDEPPAARPRKSSESNLSERSGRSRTRVAGVSQSQPGSRSGSPSSRLNYATYSESSSGSSIGNRSRWRSGASSTGGPSAVSHSTGTSRETSPNRFGSYDRSHSSRARTHRTNYGLDRTALAGSTPWRPVMAQKMLQQSREAETALADALDPFYTPPSLSRKTSRTFDEHSDDSETSSVCSERSYDRYRRPSDPYSWSGSNQRLDYDWDPNRDVSEVITRLAASQWSERKEGLLGLLAYLRNNNRLVPTELKRVTELISRMFMDSHIKVFGLFLEAVTEVVVVHHDELHDWLYILLTRMLTKAGSDVLGSILTKILRTMEIIRDCFPASLQINCALRYIVDQAQLPNTRAKVALVHYIRLLCEVMEPSDLSSARDARNALAKIIQWMQDARSQEVRRAAQAAFVSLFDVNTPHVTFMLSQLPRDSQDVAAQVIQNHVRNGGSSGGVTASNSATGAESSPLTPSSPSPRQTPRGGCSPGTSAPAMLPRPRRLNSETDSLDGFNSEEVYRSLRRTTAEIQQYSFDAVDKDRTHDGMGTGRSRSGVAERDSTSHDSGISQIDRLDTLEERFEDLRISNSQNSLRSSGQSSPSHGNGNLLNDFNGYSKDLSDGNRDNGFIRDSDENSATLAHLLELLSNVQMSQEERKNSLLQVLRLVRNVSVSVLVENFKMLFRVQLEHLRETNVSIRTLALSILTEMLRQKMLVENFHNFTELLLMKILEAHCDAEKDVIRAAELCASMIASALNPDMVIPILNPVIKTAEHPVNQAAIKLVTCMAEHHTADVLMPNLPHLMDSLIRAYDNPESSVRKAAVFCMVALYLKMGDEAMKPLLLPLNGSKLKLLHLYIKRAQQQQSSPSSPRSLPPSEK